MKVPRTSKGFTLIELLVVIGIIALLASIAVPAFTGVQIRAAQTKALSNAKQIGLACATFAIDNNGAYPSYVMQNGTQSAATVTTSNDAFDSLFPTYLQTFSLFYLAKSQWTPTVQSDPSQTTLQAGAPFLLTGYNEWAYVPGLYNTSSSSFPLIVDGFSGQGAGVDTYATSETVKGGVWKGQQAIVVFCDDHAQVLKCNTSSGSPYVPAPTGYGITNMFDTSGGNAGWLSTANMVVNPK